ncbi:MAG: methionyl-tRNA formyltransferase [Candidatus Lernaella stagnicola]|nr:methionyl-tRNA formyltransferase [Candidatus Lernaella stagnicola]
MRLIFMGTPPYAATILQYMIAEGLVPTLVVAQPDRPAGRNRKVMAPAVKLAAQAADIPVFQPEKITHEARERIIAEKPEVIIVAAYGKILRPALLEAPPLGCLNAHASLLPVYRGAAPVNWAIVNGESVTGVSIMKMDEGVDTGPVLAQRSVPIAADDTTGSLLEKLAAVAGPLILDTLRQWAAGQIEPVPQNDGDSSYAPMLSKDEGRIDWRKPATELVNHLRGMSPWPGGFTFLDERLLKILTAEAVPGEGAPGEIVRAKKELLVGTGLGLLRLDRLQLQGKKAMDAAAFLNGVKLAVGDRLGDS